MKHLSIAVFLLLIISEYSLAQEKDFRNVNWGMSEQRVKKAETASFLGEMADDGLIVYNTKVAGYDFDLYYAFVSHQLTSATYISQEEHSNKNLFIDDYKDLKSLLMKKYGKPSYDNITWNDELFKDDPSHWGLAISTGQLKYAAQWKIPKTNVLLMLSGDKYEVHITMRYEGVEFQKLENQEKESKSLEGL